MTVTNLKRAAEVRAAVLASARERIGRAQYMLYADGQIINGTEWVDCSALTRIAWDEGSEGRVKLTHNSNAQAHETWHPRLHHKHIQTGDLLFYYQPITHVGIAWRRRTGIFVVQASNPALDVNCVPYQRFAQCVGVGRPFWLAQLEGSI